MQKIDVHQTPFHCFYHHPESFMINNHELYQNPRYAGALPMYQETDLRIIISQISWPHYETFRNSLQEIITNHQQFCTANNIRVITHKEDLYQHHGQHGQDYQLSALVQFAWLDYATSRESVEETLTMISHNNIKIISLIHSTSNSLAPLYNHHNPHAWLTDLGKFVIERSNNHNILIDISGMNQSAMTQAIQHSQQPVINTHANCHWLFDTDKNMTDEMLLLLARRDGIVWLTLESAAINGEWLLARIDDFIDHISYARTIIGDDHLCLGSWYHTLPRAQLVYQWTTVETLNHLEQKLLERFDHKFTYKFLRDNMYRFLVHALTS